MDLRRLGELSAYWAQYPPAHIMLGRIALSLGAIPAPAHVGTQAKGQSAEDAVKALSSVVPTMPVPAELRAKATTPEAAHRAALELFYGANLA